MNKYYVYIYLDPRKSGQFKYGEYKFDYEPFYIGKGKGKRIGDLSKRSKYFKNKIKKIKECGLKPIVIKIKEWLDEKESFLLESELIHLIGRRNLNNGPLVNFTDGGEGTSGRIWSEETKELMSEKQRKDFSEIKNEFEKRQYKLLTEEKDYKNCYTELKYICSENHKMSIRWSDFQQGRGCYICGIESTHQKLRKDFQYIKNRFKFRNYKLLSEEKDYKDCYTKLNYICPNNHTGKISWDKFQKGQGCSECNNTLSEGDVILIKMALQEFKDISQKELGQLFGVSGSQISRIKTGKRWSHIKLKESLNE